MKKTFLAFFILIGLKSFSQLTFTVNSSTGYKLLTCSDPTIGLSIQANTSGPFTYTWTSSSSSVNSPSIAVTTVGFYTVALTDISLAQTATQTLAVNFNTFAPNPQIQISNPSVISCNNPSVVLMYTSSSGGSGIPGAFAMVDQWAGPAPQATLSGSNSYTAYVAGPYTLTVHDTKNGCVGKSITNVMDNKLVGTGSATFAIACPGTVVITPTVYTSPAFLSFSWTPLPGAGSIIGPANTKSVTVDGQGKYLCTATNSNNGCSQDDTIYVTGCVGLKTHNKFAGKVYPNPSKGNLFIENPAGQKLVFELYDNTAKLIRCEEIRELQNELILVLPKGLYYYKILTNDMDLFTDKLIIE